MFASFWKWLKGLFGFDFEVAPTPPPSSSRAQWVFQYSPGMPASFKDKFTFPPKDGVHYVVRSPLRAAIGQTITLKYRIEGSGQFVAVQAPPADMPARVRLYMQRRGDSLTSDEPNKRWWSTSSDLKVGDGELSVTVDRSSWTNVNGQGGDAVPAGAFEDAITNVGAMGFTFGGNFAGHGVYVAGGTMTFTVLEYSVH